MTVTTRQSSTGKPRQRVAPGLLGLLRAGGGATASRMGGCRCCLPPPANTSSRSPPITKKLRATMPRAASENAVGDIGYLLTQYGTDKAWLRAGDKPVLFVYHRALDELSLADWREVIVQVGRDKPGGVVLVADSLDRGFVSTFDGASTYNITGQTQRKSPPEIRAWAHATYPKIVAAAGSGKIATVTIIPGYDDRNLWRLPPRPVTDRWGGETYRALWQEAIAATPDYNLITSWNEWHEGSELEASVEYGSRILDITAAFSREFLARQR